MIAFFKTTIYIPLYNFLIFLLNIDWLDAGLAAVVLTILVKFVLYPLSKKASLTQIKMKEKDGELQAIKKKYKDRQEQALKVMEFYRGNKINPFGSILTLLIQMPIIISLYYIFLRSGLPDVDASLLYSFVKAPESVSMVFLGFLDVSQKSILLAGLAGISSFWQMHLSAPSKFLPAGAPLNKENFPQMMAKQMKYTMPIVVFVISWQLSGIIALYWFISNLMSIIQDWWIKKRLKKT